MADRKQLMRTIRQLADSQPDNARLRDHLEGLSKDPEFPALTWFWGPILYARSRPYFEPFIRNYFATWEGSGLRFRQIPWSQRTPDLEAWLLLAKRQRDAWLTLRLHTWKYAAKRQWGVDSKDWSSALLKEYQAADHAADRAFVLATFDTYFDLEEAAAVAMYATDRNCGSFLLRHLPSSFWLETKRKPWRQLMAAAERSGDEKLYWSLYRKQTPVKQWQAEVMALAKTSLPGPELCAALKLRHLEGWGLSIGAVLVQLLELRGRDVFPYVMECLPRLWHRWGDVSAPFVKLAKEREWWDLWAGAIRADYRNKPFNEAVSELLVDPYLQEETREERFRALVGVSREWNWPGLGLAIVHQLDESNAVALYARHPDLIRGPYRLHVMPRWDYSRGKLLAAAMEHGDDELIDLLASRYATMTIQSMSRVSKQPALADIVNQITEYYRTLQSRDVAEFGRRACGVLTRIPAYAIDASAYEELLRTNSLSRLLFVRSLDSFLGAPAGVKDLVEGSEIHVQMLAYRVLALADDRARQLAVDNLDILLGTLLRPLHRKTRIAAFHALANAAIFDFDAALRILSLAREAMHLPDKKYPKEELVGLIGRILDAQPDLQSPSERPVIYGPVEI